MPGAFKLTAGVGYRYIQGVGVADVRVSSGSLLAYSSLSPVFDVNYGSLASSPTFNYKIGNGFDLGSMTWTGNVVTANDQALNFPKYTGLTNYDVIRQLVNQFGASGETLFSYQTAQERRTSLPTKLRLGGGARLSALPHW